MASVSLPGERMAWTGYQRALAALLVVFWAVAAPVSFILLYLVLDLQLAARSADQTQPDISEYKVFQAAQRLSDIDAQLDHYSDARPALWAALQQTKGKYDLARSDLRNSTLDFTAAHDLPVDPAACPADWPQASVCYDTVRVIAGHVLMGPPRPDLAAMKTELEGLKATARTAKQAVATYNVAVGQWNEHHDAVLTLAAARGEEIKKWPASVASVAETLISLRKAAGVVGWLYLIPFGVVVAFFTALMGAIGAGAASLVKDLRARNSSTTFHSDLVGLYVINPGLGLVAGFLVFFVVSAGALVLVQPGGGAGHTVIDQLSPAALASTGVLAGLAAEAAIGWLTDRAKSVFKRDKPPAHKPCRCGADEADADEPTEGEAPAAGG
jgi:hypothetical protein